MIKTPECLRVLSAEELAAVPVATPGEIRAVLRRAGEELREAATAPKRVVRMRGHIVGVTRPAYVSAGLDSSYYLDDDETGTPIGSGGAARGYPPPSSVEPSLRAGVRVRPRARSAQNNPAGTSPADRKES